MNDKPYWIENERNRVRITLRCNINYARIEIPRSRVSASNRAVTILRALNKDSIV